MNKLIDAYRKLSVDNHIFHDYIAAENNPANSQINVDENLKNICKKFGFKICAIFDIGILLKYNEWFFVYKNGILPIEQIIYGFYNCSEKKYYYDIIGNDSTSMDSLKKFFDGPIDYNDYYAFILKKKQIIKDIDFFSNDLMTFKNISPPLCLFEPSITYEIICNKKIILMKINIINDTNVTRVTYFSSENNYMPISSTYQFDIKTFIPFINNIFDKHDANKNLERNDFLISVLSKKGRIFSDIKINVNEFEFILNPGKINVNHGHNGCLKLSIKFEKDKMKVKLLNIFMNRIDYEETFMGEAYENYNKINQFLDKIIYNEI